MRAKFEASRVGWLFFFFFFPPPSPTKKFHHLRSLGKADVVPCQTIPDAFSAEFLLGKQRGSSLRDHQVFCLAERLSWEGGVGG